MAFSITDIIILSIILIFTIFGAIKGIIGKILGWVNLFISIVISYYISAPITSLFLKTEFYTNMVNSIGEKWSNVLLLILTGIVVFIILFIIFKLFTIVINKCINANKIFGFFNKTLGAFIGFAFGLFLATLYLLIFYGLAKIDPNINAFYVSDLAITDEKFTFSKMLMTYTMKIFN